MSCNQHYLSVIALIKRWLISARRMHVDTEIVNSFDVDVVLSINDFFIIGTSQTP